MSLMSNIRRLLNIIIMLMKSSAYLVTRQTLQTAPKLTLEVVYDDAIVLHPPCTPFLLACKLHRHPLERCLLLGVMFYRRLSYDSIQVFVNTIK
jgi:hypothetical protein